VPHLFEMSFGGGAVPPERPAAEGSDH
jgi:hypothetical protein